MPETVRNMGGKRVARCETVSFDDARAWRNERERYELQEGRVVLNGRAQKNSRNPEYFGEVTSATAEWCRMANRLRKQRQARRRESEKLLASQASDEAPSVVDKRF